LLVSGAYAAADVTAHQRAAQPAAQQRAAQPAARTVVLTAGDPVGEKMEYSRKQILAKPGERLKVQLISTGQLPKVAMAHNFVLLKLGSDAKKFSEVAAGARATDFIPASLRTQIIANTDLVGPGERTEVTFTVPKVPGTYPYLCSFAGHFAAGMFGDLIVK
jgi:azurin